MFTQGKKTKYPQISSERDRCYRDIIRDKDGNMAINLGTNIYSRATNDSFRYLF